MLSPPGPAWTWALKYTSSFTWRASFALSEWYRDVPGGLNPFDQIVVIAFPDESRDDPGAARADDLPAPDLPGDEPADANL